MVLLPPGCNRRKVFGQHSTSTHVVGAPSNGVGASIYSKATIQEERLCAAPAWQLRSSGCLVRSSIGRRNTVRRKYSGSGCERQGKL